MLRHDLNTPDLDVQIDRIANALAQKGYYIATDLISHKLTERLKERALSLAGAEWKQAGIGQGDVAQVNRQVRANQIAWLSTENDSAEIDFLGWIEQVRMGLNRRLFLGLFDYEAHFSIYHTGGFYQKHLDAFTGQKSRVVSTILYLNSQWQEADAGELVIYNKSGYELTRVLPRLGTCVIFLSEQFPHEVLPTIRKRLCIAGWYRVQSMDPLVNADATQGV